MDLSWRGCRRDGALVVSVGRLMTGGSLWGGSLATRSLSKSALRDEREAPWQEPHHVLPSVELDQLARGQGDTGRLMQLVIKMEMRECF